LKKFVKFDSAASALTEAASLKEGKVPSILSQLLDDIKEERKASLAVADKALGASISKLLADFDITTISDSTTMEVFREIRGHLTELIPGLQPENIDRMALGLSHSMSRHKLRFSADKIDSMVIQAVKLLDDLDKELNVYAMRTKEWYGWHFPELAKILNDNVVYCRLVLEIGMRTNFAEADLDDILPEELVGPVKNAAEISMGTEITEEDMENIKILAGQVITYTQYRSDLSSYLESRMRAISPNATALLGFLVGARLVSHAGSLINLAKAPGSTIQILGAEKALFRALKTKHDTPKYGLIYHSSLVGQATGRNKGKIARMLSAKVALGLRIDALTEEPESGEVMDDDEKALFGIANRSKLENALRRLEGRPLLGKGVNVGPDGQVLAPGAFALKEVRRYNADADGVDTSAVNGKSIAKLPRKPLIQVVESQDEEMKDLSDSEDESEAKKPASKKSTSTAPAKPLKESRKEAKVEKKAKKSKDKQTEATATPAKSATPAHSVVKTPKPLSEADFARLAEAAGISVVKFKRKYERGDVELNADGTPRVYSKKELKKMRKAEETPAAASVVDSGKKVKKGKHEDEAVETPKKEKKRRLSEDDVEETPKKEEKRKHGGDDGEAASKKEKKDKKKRKHDDDEESSKKEKKQKKRRVSSEA
jgi:nucleolar protein 58